MDSCIHCGEPVKVFPYSEIFEGEIDQLVHANGCIITKHCVDRTPGAHRRPLETIAEIKRAS